MSNIQIRNVPEDLHRHLKARAARMGLSLSDYLLREVKVIAERPTLEELQKRIARLGRARVSVSPADVVRSERDSR